MTINGSRLLGGIAAVSIGALLTIVAGCNGKQQPRWKQQAGVGQKEMGVIVRGATADDIQKLSPMDGVTFRKLYGGDVEVSGLSEAEIRGLLPKASLKRNIYYENLVPLKSRPDLSNFQSTEGQPFDIRSCRKLPSPPVPNVEVLKNREKLLRVGILDDVDGGVAFDASASHAAIQTSKPLEIMWVVMGPEGSKYAEHVVGGPKLEVEPDELGAYGVFLVLKDERDACSLVRIMFGVTHNEPYAGRGPVRTFTEQQLAHFAHLKVVGATDAWKMTRGQGVKIAVLDSGVNYNHPDLSPNIAINTNEIPGNGIDDDGNGIPDDVYGVDFVMGDNQPFDDNRHGTHVAGLAASSTTGIAPDAQILPIKVSNAFGGGDLASIEAGIRYAVDQGAHILNMSFGGEAEGIPIELAAAFQYAEDHGVLIVVAAGNGDQKTGEGFDIDVRPVVPAGLPYPNILTVAASKLSGGLTKYSNYGIKGVDISAPGGDREEGPLFAPGFNPKKAAYLGLGGTSMAAPIVSGVAALVMSTKQHTNLQTKDIILKTARKHILLQGKVGSGGMVDAFKATSYARSGTMMMFTALE